MFLRWRPKQQSISIKNLPGRAISPFADAAMRRQYTRAAASEMMTQLICAPSARHLTKLTSSRLVQTARPGACDRLSRAVFF
jgi:hypothetical protein